MSADTPSDTPTRHTKVLILGSGPAGYNRCYLCTTRHA